MNLNDVHRGIRKRKRPQRVGRGPGSGHGKTSGRGHKGQGQLAGWTQHAGFEGGQFPLYRRIPKRGFHNRYGEVVCAINLGAIDAVFAAGEEVNRATLKAHNLASHRFDILKILAGGTISKKLKIAAHAFSKSAIEKIEAAGGEAIVVPGPAPVVKNKQGTALAAAVAKSKRRATR